MNELTGRRQEHPRAAAPEIMREPALEREFFQVRGQSEEICARLELEDHVVQPAPFVSPPKWHLAHTSWFFSRFVLEQVGRNGAGSIPGADLLFNSYYKSLGSHWRQESRGQLSRPTVRAVMGYRREVTERVMELLVRDRLAPHQREAVMIGLQHEKQHQELLLMDIKYIFAGHPHPPAFDELSLPRAVAPPAPLHWRELRGGLLEFGAPSPGFAYDNEKPRHRACLPAYQIADRLVTNGEYMEFILDGGYERPELWLSDGWDWVRANDVGHPLYWRQEGERWCEYHLGGLDVVHPHLPVSHVSYYEAEAFARWRGARLPTEFELEALLAGREVREEAFWAPGEPVCPLPGKAADPLGNGLLWQWSASAHAPYPGFRPETGALGEYNGKFMCNQYVLRGGCVATPRRHVRPSYRNFYRAYDRWPFTGIRLARDCQ